MFRVIFRSTIFWAAWAAWAVVSPSPAQGPPVPREFSLQGVANGYASLTINIVVRFYDGDPTPPASPAVLWAGETHVVPIGTREIYKIHVGSLTIGPPAGIPNSAFATTSGEVWAGVKVGADPEFGVRLLSVPFALKSLYAEGLVIPDTTTSAATIDTSGIVTLGSSSNRGELNLKRTDGTKSVAVTAGTSAVGGGGILELFSHTGQRTLVVQGGLNGSDAEGGPHVDIFDGAARALLAATSLAGSFLTMRDESGSVAVSIGGSDILYDGGGHVALYDAEYNPSDPLHIEPVIELMAEDGSGEARVTLRQDNTEVLRLSTQPLGGRIEIKDGGGNSAVDLDGATQEITVRDGTVTCMNGSTDAVVLSSAARSVLVQDGPANVLIRATSSSSFIELDNSTEDDVIRLDSSDGRVTAKIIEITGGADLAERFPASETLEPGMLVAIDREHAGKLCVARGAYNHCVAGVVSGANNLSAGAILGNLPKSDDAPPIALSGRVWVHCDATSGPIRPGDLLTTSDSPGHAMRAVDRKRSHGAVIGKAMTSLETNRGLVLVLVNLQ